MLERDRERLLESHDRLLGLAEQEVEPAQVDHHPAGAEPVGDLLEHRLRPLRVGARENPVPVALGDQRGLEVDLTERAGILHRLGELERALDVVARGLVIPLAPVAARAPGEDVGAQHVGGKRRALDQRERLGEQRERGRDARDRVAPDREPEQHLGAIEVGELGALDERAGLLEQVERGTDIALANPRPALAGEEPNLELDCAGGDHRPERAAVLVDRGVVLALPDERLGARRAPPRCAPARRPRRRSRGRSHRRRAGRASHSIVSAGRPRLPALDLRDVLLREAVTRELGLGEPGGDPQLADAVAERDPRGSG